MSRNRRKRQKNRIGLIILVIAAAVIAAALVIMIMRTRKNETSVSDVSSQEAQFSPESAKELTEEPTQTPTAEPTEEPTAEPTAEPTQTPTAEPTQIPTAEPTEEAEQETAAELSEDTLQSLYGYMIRVSDRSVLIDKLSGDIIYPASMTKVMTAIVALENLPDLDETLTVTSDIIDPLYEEDASMAGFTAGETPTVRDLLYGVLLPSGAEACETLAVRVAGSEEAFVELMNQKAAELGLSDTHFTNCTGLHNEDHYTTCREMETIFEYALSNETFYQIITSAEYTCAPNEYHEDGLYMQSTMFKNLDCAQLDNGAVILGGKTGTTDEAGYCLASFASFNGDIYILVTAMGQYNEEGTHVNVEDACAAYGALR